MFFVGTPDHVEGRVGADSFFMVSKSLDIGRKTLGVPDVVIVQERH